MQRKLEMHLSDSFWLQPRCPILFFSTQAGEGGREEEGLTSHRVWAGHEVQRDGVGRVGGHAFQVALWDFVEAVGGGGHVFIQPVQKRVHAWFLGVPLLQVSPGAFAILAASLHVLRIAGQCGCNTTQPALSQCHLSFYCGSELINSRFDVMPLTHRTAGVVVTTHCICVRFIALGFVLTMQESLSWRQHDTWIIFQWETQHINNCVKHKLTMLLWCSAWKLIHMTSWQNFC